MRCVQMKVTNLRVNQLENPIGISGEDLRFSWLPINAVKQTAFYVVVKDANGTLIEDSGKIETGKTTYDLKTTVLPKTEVIWTVQLWDEFSQPCEIATARFETGMTHFKAKWINPELEINPEERQPGSYLKKCFNIDQLGKGRLYITSHGIFNAYLNGKPVSENVLMPGTTQVTKRLMVETIDVTEFLQLGANELIVTLGDGWYRGCMGNSMTVNNFGTDVALICQLEIDDEVVVVSDESWLASQNGPLRENDTLKGEKYDATKEEIIDWHAVKTEDFDYENLIYKDTVSMREFETFKPTLIVTPSGERVLDFGQNISGYVRFKINAIHGQKITLIHGEALDKDGNFTIENFQNPRLPECHAQVDYICKDGLNEYAPTKTYFGFQFVKIEADFEISVDDFTAIAVYSKMKQTGFFECGIPAVNQLFSNALWSMKGNFVDVPTDCPTREKSGYSGDAQLFIHTALYLMDSLPVFRKWHFEQCATQFEDGCVKQVAPDGDERNFKDGGAAWCDSMEILPYKLMERYSDDSVIATTYESVKKWLLFCLERAKETREENRDLMPEELLNYYVDTGFMWGEWQEPGINVMEYMMDIGKNGEPEVGTAYLAYGCRLLSEMAQKLGHEADAEFFANASAKAREAYRIAFIKDGVIESPRQCRYARPIALGLIAENERFVNTKLLADNIKNNGGKLNTGFLSTPELCRVLTDGGQVVAAYDLLLQQEQPSWLYSISKNATTIWESWHGVDEDGTLSDSLNHYAYGAIVGWLFDRACGINVEFGNITIKPYPDQRLGFAKATYDSPVGTIKSSWKYATDKIIYDIEIPCNKVATVDLQDGEIRTLAAGSYNFEVVI